MVIGALITSVLAAGAAGLALWASLEHRPAVDDSPSFLLLYTAGTVGVVDFEVELGDPIDLNQLHRDIELNLLARISDPSLETALIVSAELAQLMTDCAGFVSGIESKFDDLTPGQQEAVAAVSAHLPRRASLTADSSPQPGQYDEDVRGARFTVFSMSFATTEDYVFEFGTQFKAYPASVATASCSLPGESIVQTTDWGPTAVAVNSLNIAARMEGGGKDSLARAAYDIQISDAVEWNAKRRTFTDLEKRGQEGDVRWRASGDYWWRITDERLGVVQPAGYGIFEPEGASSQRATLRYVAGYCAAVSIGALVIAARRCVTYASARYRSSDDEANA